MVPSLVSVIRDKLCKQGQRERERQRDREREGHGDRRRGRERKKKQAGFRNGKVECGFNFRM